jgi:hypothetical protein
MLISSANGNAACSVGGVLREIDRNHDSVHSSGSFDGTVAAGHHP